MGRERERASPSLWVECELTAFLCLRGGQNAPSIPHPAVVSLKSALVREGKWCVRDRSLWFLPSTTRYVAFRPLSFPNGSVLEIYKSHLFGKSCRGYPMAVEFILFLLHAFCRSVFVGCIFFKVQSIQGLLNKKFANSKILNKNGDFFLIFINLFMFWCQICNHNYEILLKICLKNLWIELKMQFFLPLRCPRCENLFISYPYRVKSYKNFKNSSKSNIWYYCIKL